MATRRVNRLSDEELTRALELAKRSDSVELKLTVPASDHRATLVALGLDPLEAQIRQVFFFDFGRQRLPGRSRVAPVPHGKGRGARR